MTQNINLDSIDRQKFAAYLERVTQLKSRKLGRKELSAGDKTKKIHAHHIIPRCLNGSNARDNIVHVYEDEHVELHKLLTMVFVRGTDELKLMQYVYEKMSSKVKVAKKIASRAELAEWKPSKTLEKYLNRWSKKVPYIEDCIVTFLIHQPVSTKQLNALFEQKYQKRMPNCQGFFTFMRKNAHKFPKLT